ncbi:Polyketide synthase PksN [compost metagenome]
MSCQFAESADLQAFWDNLCQGRACVTRWSEEQLIELKVPEAIRRNPQFVPVKAVLDDKHVFDAAFFGLSPRDAGFMRPAMKHLLMHA